MWVFLLGFVVGCIATIIYEETEPKKKKREYDHLSDYYSTPKENFNDDEFGV